MTEAVTNAQQMNTGPAETPALCFAHCGAARPPTSRLANLLDSREGRELCCPQVPIKAWLMLPGEIASVTATYLSRFPGDAAGLSPLTDLLADGADVTSRKEFRGHVTCCGIVRDDAGRFLMIRHRTLEAWLFPGGHLEEVDVNLRGAAMREVAEETGLSGDSLRGFGHWFDSAPVQIDCHPIPANPAKGEPAHRHMDFRYLFRGNAGALSPQLEEVTDCAWVDADQIPAEIHARLQQLALL